LYIVGEGGFSAVALERTSIEKNDFPVGRRGYDPAAVDAHLSTIADEVEELTRSAQRPRGESLSSTASEQVRAIIEAAEKSAEEIQQRVEQEARQIRAEARREARKERAQATADAEQEREQATQQAREYVAKVSESTSQMLGRLDTMDSELTALTESLRTGSGKLKDELDVLEAELRDLSGTTTRGPGPRAGLDELEEEPEAQEEEEEKAFEPEQEAEAPGVAEEPEPVTMAEPAAVDDGDDAEGARLIALNMALNGTPRDETDRYLAENFELSDRVRLLDEVYASVDA
jgi:DivIVA domain-containing protein